MSFVAAGGWAAAVDGCKAKGIKMGAKSKAANKGAFDTTQRIICIRHL